MHAPLQSPLQAAFGSMTEAELSALCLSFGRADIAERHKLAAALHNL